MIELEQNAAELEASLQSAPWALRDLPPFPVVATRLVQLLSKEDVEIGEVGKFIAAEPVFSARVLQMANSPLFALHRQVRTIPHAVIVLGLERVRAIALTRALNDFVTPALRVKTLRSCWQNSLAGAVIAEKLARVCRMDSDFAYVAGLLRDIGRLALLVNYPESYANLLEVSREHAYDLLIAERDLFDIDHCQAGWWVMKTLPFPLELCEVVARHHEAPIGKPFRMVHLIHIADRIADALGFSVLAPSETADLEEVLEQLPEESRTRFSYNADELRDEVNSRIKSWG